MEGWVPVSSEEQWLSVNPPQWVLPVRCNQDIEGRDFSMEQLGVSGDVRPNFKEILKNYR